MIFQVSRTSVWYNIRPCKEAKTVSVSDKIGTKDIWIIELYSLEDLEKFIEENGDVIIFAKDPEELKPYSKIEIYDDYRE